MIEPDLPDTGFVPEAFDSISRERAALVAATLDVDPALLASGELPLPWHWAFFNPGARTSDLGPDGHPRRRAEMDAFPQRMWVGGRVEYVRPLVIGHEARRESRVASAQLKEGTSGRFWLVTVEHTIHQSGVARLHEQQDLALREPASAPVEVGTETDAVPDAEWIEACTARPTLLFRYSALTFNAHRIHYDAPYATGVERYPDLVVHGPLIATLLCELARRRRPDATVRALTFRAHAPLFGGRRFWLTGGPTPGGASLAAVRGDGVTAMALDLRYA